MAARMCVIVLLCMGALAAMAKTGGHTTPVPIDLPVPKARYPFHYTVSLPFLYQNPQSAATSWRSIRGALPTVESGSTGPLAEAVQYLLQSWGYHRVGDDWGKVDQHTTRSLQYFQEHQGLSPTGVVDAITWQHLFRMLYISENSPAATAAGTLLRDVYGYKNLQPSSYYGKELELSVDNFQRTFGIVTRACSFNLCIDVCDGTLSGAGIGPLTWKVLISNTLTSQPQGTGSPLAGTTQPVTQLDAAEPQRGTVANGGEPPEGSGASAPTNTVSTGFVATISPAQLKVIFPNAKEDTLDTLAPHLQRAMTAFHIETPIQAAGFLAVVSIDSDDLNSFQEEGKATDEVFARYERLDELGNTEPGDGFKFRGRGAISIRGRLEYGKVSREMGLNDRLLDEPDVISDPQHPANIFLSAAAYWKLKDCNYWAERCYIGAITRLLEKSCDLAKERYDAFRRSMEALGAMCQETMKMDCPVEVPVRRPEDDIPTPQPLSTEQKEFLDKVKGAAQSAEKETGVRASVLLGLAILGSRWGETDLAKQTNNYFGLRGAGFSQKDRIEEPGGEQGFTSVTYRKYGSPEQAFKDIGEYIKNGRQSSALLAKSTASFADELLHIGYQVDGTALKKTIDMYNLQQYDKK